MIVSISTVSCIVFLILRDTTNVIDTRFTETYNAGSSATAITFLRSIKNAVILRVSLQRATPWLNEERRHIAGPNATGSFIMQKCICNIFRVESFIRFSPHENQCITHTDSVGHNNISFLKMRAG